MRRAGSHSQLVQPRVPTDRLLHGTAHGPIQLPRGVWISFSTTSHGVCSFAVVLVTCLISALLPAGLWGQAVQEQQTVLLPTERYHFETWTTDDGLPQNSVIDIVQTRDGYLWLATFAGLARFDGLSFKVFDLASAMAAGPGRRFRHSPTSAGDTPTKNSNAAPGATNRAAPSDSYA